MNMNDLRWWRKTHIHHFQVSRKRSNFNNKPIINMEMELNVVTYLEIWSIVSWVKLRLQERKINNHATKAINKQQMRTKTRIAKIEKQQNSHDHEWEEENAPTTTNRSYFSIQSSIYMLTNESELNCCIRPTNVNFFCRLFRRIFVISLVAICEKKTAIVYRLWYVIGAPYTAHKWKKNPKTNATRMRAHHSERRDKHRSSILARSNQIAVYIT